VRGLSTTTASEHVVALQLRLESTMLDVAKSMVTGRLRCYAAA